MISIEDRALFSRAEAKARQIKPRVTVVTFGEYRVAGSKGTEYTVRFSKSTTGHWVASCTCPAHVADGRPDYVPKPCYHLPSAYSVHAALVYKRQQQREQEHPLPRCECGKPGFACHEDRWFCIGCIEGAQRDGLEDLGELDEARQQAAEDEAELDEVREMLQLERDREDLFG
jgi:hypothetical protein